MTLVNQYPSISKHMQQATFAYRATKQQLRYVENIWPPNVAEFYFQLFTLIKHILLHNMRRRGFKRTKGLLVIFRSRPKYELHIRDGNGNLPSINQSINV